MRPLRGWLGDRLRPLTAPVRLVTSSGLRLACRRGMLRRLWPFVPDGRRSRPSPTPGRAAARPLRPSRPHRHALVAVAVAAVVCSSSVTAAAPPLLALRDEQPVPRNDGWVTDLAGLLTATEQQQLETLSESYRSGSGYDIALLTVPDLQGEPIEAFALRVAREWKLGSEDKSEGALLVVSKGDRQLRVEVGRGLEGTLTDAVSARVIRDVITPRFQDGDFAGGLRQGLEALHKAAGGDYGPLPERRSAPGSSWLAIPFLAFVLLMIFVVTRRRGKRGGRRGSVWPWILVDAATRGGLGGRGGGLGGGGFGGLGGGFGGGGFGGGGGGFGGFGGGGGFSGGGASGRW